MSGVVKDDLRLAASKPKSCPKRSALSPVTLQLTPGEREWLEELARGMTLIAYNPRPDRVMIR